MKWQSRKFIVAVVAIVCATVLAHQEKLSAEAWTELVKWIGIAYLGAQGAVDYISNKKGGA